MQQVFKGGTCNPTHITQENKAKIKLSSRRPGGSPCSAPAATNRTHPAHTHPQRDSEEACPSRSQWEYKTVGFLFGYFAIRSLKFARATSLPGGQISIPSSKLLRLARERGRRGYGHRAPDQREKGTRSSNSTKCIRNKPAHPSPSNY